MMTFPRYKLLQLKDIVSSKKINHKEKVINEKDTCRLTESISTKIMVLKDNTYYWLANA